MKKIGSVGMIYASRFTFVLTYLLDMPPLKHELLP